MESELTTLTLPRILEDGESARYWNTLRRRGHFSPEQDLMLAVLKDGLLSYRKNLRKPGLSRFDDREWFFSVHDDCLFSFESVCMVLGLSAQRIRKRLLDWERDAHQIVSAQQLVRGHKNNPPSV
jgi:hypothetical protein